MADEKRTKTSPAPAASKEPVQRVPGRQDAFGSFAAGSALGLGGILLNSGGKTAKAIGLVLAAAGAAKFSSGTAKADTGANPARGGASPPQSKDSDAVERAKAAGFAAFGATAVYAGVDAIKDASSKGGMFRPATVGGRVALRAFGGAGIVAGGLMALGGAAVAIMGPRKDGGAKPSAPATPAAAPPGKAYLNDAAERRAAQAPKPAPAPVSPVAGAQSGPQGRQSYTTLDGRVVDGTAGQIAAWGNRRK